MFMFEDKEEVVVNLNEVIPLFHDAIEILEKGGEHIRREDMSFLLKAAVVTINDLYDILEVYRKELEEMQIEEAISIKELDEPTIN